MKAVVIDGYVPASVAPQRTVRLRAIDRCDRCNARASVRATKLLAVLLLCGHHGAQHAHKLADQGWYVETPGQET